MSGSQDSTDTSQQKTLEMAYVLFMDIVGYSRMPTDVQHETLRILQACVQSGSEFRKAQVQQRLVSLPTGDGMALAFFGDPESGARCAVETTQALKKEKQIPLRMGLHAGPVYRVTDINANQNVAGDGINIAQRVMDCGDAGHILASKAQADVLRQLSNWMGALQDLGEVSVKHGVRVHIFNLVLEGMGNSEKPRKLQAESAKDNRAKKVKRSWVRWAGGAVAVGLIAGAVWWRVERTPAAYAYRPKIALLGFADMTGNRENEWVSRVLTEDLTSDLESSEKVVTVPGETVSQMERDLSLTKEISYSPGTMSRVHSYLDCDYVVYGSFYDVGKAAGGRVTLNVRLQDTRTGQMWSLPEESGTELALREVAFHVGAGLRGKLGLPNPSVTETQEMASEMPATPEAQKLYAKGLASEWNYELADAARYFQDVKKLDPNFALAHAELSEVWHRQGYDENAKEEATMANNLASHLGRESKLRVEAGFFEMSSDWENAADSYRALWIGWRERPEYALRAAAVQVRAGKPEAALVTLAQLRKEPGRMVNNPAIDLGEAEAYEGLSDWKKEATAAGMAAQKAHEQGKRMLEAEGQWRLCGARLSLSELDGAESACAAGQRLANDTHYRLVVARSYADLGMVARARGNFPAALDAEQRALDVAKEVGSQRDVIGALQNMGVVYADQGMHDKAVANYGRALAVAKETQNKTATLENYNNLATEYQSSGDLKQAADYYGKSLALAKETKNALGEVDAGANLASLQAAQGNLKDAALNLKEALRLARDSGFKDRIAILLTMFGDILLEQGAIAEAQKSYDDALAASNTPGGSQAKAAAETSMGKLFVATRRFAEAEKQARTAVEEFQREGAKDQVAAANAVLAEALIGQDKLPEASAILKTARDAKPGDEEIRMDLELANIRLLGRSGNWKDARTLQVQTLKDARRIGMQGWQLKLELAGGELGLEKGNGQPDPSVLRSVERRAEKLGYGLIRDEARRGWKSK